MKLTQFLSVIIFGFSIVSARADWSPLIDPSRLAELADHEEAVVLDIRSASAYAEGHVPGAVNVPYRAWRGPQDNPGALIDDAKLSLLLSEAGIEPDIPVVITYEGTGTLDFGSAARVYWTLKSAGVDQIAILNGGLSAWTSEGRSLSTEEGSNFPSDIKYSFRPDWMIDAGGIDGILRGTRPALLVDARPEDFFRGAAKHPLARVAGTLAGALNLPHAGWFAGNKIEVDTAAVHEIAAQQGYHAGGPDIVSFCNTGHWAATNWFVLSEIGGIEGVRLYPESLVGWTRARTTLASN